MTHVCPYCSHEFVSEITFDYLGWHTSCPICEGSFDVDVLPAAYIVRSALIGYILENKNKMDFENKRKMKRNVYLKQAKDMFTALAMLLALEPDTAIGDELLDGIYISSGLPEVILKEDFDLYMWQDLT